MNNACEYRGRVIYYDEKFKLIRKTDNKSNCRQNTDKQFKRGQKTPLNFITPSIVNNRISHLAPFERVADAFFNRQLRFPAQKLFCAVSVGIRAGYVARTGWLDGNRHFLAINFFKRGDKFFHGHAIATAKINDDVG